MKNLFYIFGLSLALILAACSGTDNNMPVAPSLEKSIADVNSFPYQLYQVFPELSSASVRWYNESDGLVIEVSDRAEIVTNKYLFATIEFVNNQVATLAFLGDLRTGKYFLNGVSEKEVGKISVFYYESTFASDTRQPYSSGQIFNGLSVKRWDDGGSYVKVTSYPFSGNIDYMYAQLIGSGANQLVFIGRPNSQNFEFPKSEKISLKDINLFTY